MKEVQSRSTSMCSVTSVSSSPGNTDDPHEEKCCCSSVGLEPVLFIQNIVSQMVYVTSQDLMVEKTCKVNHDLTSDVCNNLSQYDKTEEIINDEISELLMWRGIFESSIKLVAVLLMGPWSDRWGRRLPLMVCLLLLMGETVLMLINAHQQQWPLEMMLLCSIPYGLSGGHYALLMLCFSHVAHTSTTKRRTFRMGFLDTFWYFGKTIGLALKPVVQDAAGYDGVFITSIVLYILAIVYVFFRLRGESYPGQLDKDTGACRQCSLEHLSDGLNSITKNRSHRNRLHIIILISIMLLDAFAATGEGNVRYLFVLRAVDWTSNHYSLWYSLTSLLSVVGGFIIVPALTLLRPLSDPVIGMVGSTSRILTNLSYASVNQPSEDWLLYLGAALGSFTVLAPVAVRALLSKITKEEIGGVFGVMAAGETVIVFLSAPVYNSIYNVSNEYNPGAYNYFSAIVHGTMFAAFGFVLHSMTRHKSLGSDQTGQ